MPKNYRVSIKYTSGEMYGNHYYFHDLRYAENKLMRMIKQEVNLPGYEETYIVDFDRGEVIHHERGIIWKRGDRRIYMGYYSIEIVKIN